MRSRFLTSAFLCVAFFGGVFSSTPAVQAQFLASPFGAGLFSGSTASTQIPRPLYFKRRIDSSKLRLGPFFFKPYFGLRDASIVSDFGGPLNNLNFDDPNFDLSIAAGIGVRGYVSPYRRSIVAFHALPEYTWLLDNRDQRRFTGTFGLGSFNYFGRLGLEVSKRRSLTQRFFAADAPVVTVGLQDRSRIAAEYRVWRDLRLFTTFTRRDLDSRDDRDGFDVLDRRSDELRFGVIYQMPRNIKVALLRSEVDVEFGSTARDLSSRRVSDEFQFSVGFHRVGISLILQDLDVTAQRGSLAVDSNRTLGRIGMPITPRTSTAFVPYVARTADFAATGNFSEIVRERIGMSFRTKYRDYATIRLAVETGTDEYVPFVDNPSVRVDDVVTVGGRLNLTLPRIERWVVPTVRFTRSEYSSNFPNATRTVSTVSFSLSIDWPWIPTRIRLPWKRFAWGDSGGTGW